MAINASTIHLASLFTDFSLINYLSDIKSMLILVLGIAIYAIFVFKFYRFLAKRDILKLELHKYSRSFEGGFKNFIHVVFYLIENVILTPILVFIWFAVLAILLLVISKGQTPAAILVTSIALIAAVRICSYYDEELARELAKIVPLALLGVFLVENISFFSITTTIETIKEIFSLWKVMIYYLIFVVAVELILRLVQVIVSLIRGDYKD